MGENKYTPKSIWPQSTYAWERGTAITSGQHHILPQQRNGEPSSKDEGLNLIVKILVLLRKHLPGLNNRSMPGAFPSVLDHVKHKTPYTGHLPMYLW